MKCKQVIIWVPYFTSRLLTKPESILIIFKGSVCYPFRKESTHTYYFYFNFWSTDFFFRDAHSGQQHKHLQNRNICNCISPFKNAIWYQNRTWRKPQYQCDKYLLTITEYFLRRFLYSRKHLRSSALQ